MQAHHEQIIKDLEKLLDRVGALLECIGDEMNKTVEEVVDDMDLADGLKECFLTAIKDLDDGLKECLLTGIQTDVWTDFISKHEDNPQTALSKIIKAALKLAGKRVPDLNAKVRDELAKLDLSLDGDLLTKLGLGKSFV
ncbi:uncharacterized protein O3C94_003129 [Discoglossus pictus]